MHTDKIFGQVGGFQEFLDHRACSQIFFQGLVHTLGPQGLIQGDTAGESVKMIHRETKFPVGEIGHGFGTGCLREERLVVIRVYPGEADLVDGRVGHNLLSVESSMVIEKV